MQAVILVGGNITGSTQTLASAALEEIQAGDFAGGIALGLDRIVMILAGASSLREVIAFPKTAKAIDLMVDAPTPVSEQQLRELHLKIRGQG